MYRLLGGGFSCYTVKTAQIRLKLQQLTKMGPRVACVFLAFALVSGAEFETPDYWRSKAREDIKRAKGIHANHGMAKNIIIMIGDGMGLTTVTAGRIYKGQKNGQTGEEYQLNFETFPNIGLAKTYNLDRQVPDSAGTASSIMSGVKVNFGTLGVDGDVPYGEDCSAYNEARKLKTVLDYASEAGMAVGIVTTARVTHATPGATYGHIPWRDWESDTNMAGIEGCEHVKDLAYQLVMDNPNINVILGGGRRSFLNNTTPDPFTGKISSSQRSDGLDLRREWQQEKASRGMAYAYVETRDQLLSADLDNLDHLMGLFTSSHMSYELERDPSVEPSLQEMTEAAIRVLRRNNNGYFLLVEGGRIDHGHHDNLAKKALEELSVFDDTVQLVKDMVPPHNTLQIVTADHSHVFSIAGYPTRGNDILGVVDRMEPNEAPYDGFPYLTLTYANGPAYGRTDLTGVDTTGNNFQQPGCIGMGWETHSGEDVGIYARGPMAHLIHTTHEQHYIGHVLMYAACIGDYSKTCDFDKRERKSFVARMLNRV